MDLNEFPQIISTLATSPSEETLVAATDRGQLYTISLLPVGMGNQGELADIFFVKKQQILFAAKQQPVGRYLYSFYTL